MYGHQQPPPSGPVMIVGGDNGMRAVAAANGTVDRALISRCMQLSVAEGLDGLVLMSVFWAAYGWVIVLAATAIVVACIAFVHCKSRLDFYTNDCCCSPLIVCANLMNAHIAITIMGLFASVTSAVAAGVHCCEPYRGAAIVSCLASVVMSGIGVYGTQMFRQLDEEVRSDPQFQRYQVQTIFVQPNGAEMAPAVAQGVPIHVQPWPQHDARREEEVTGPGTYPAPPGAYPPPPSSYPPPPGAHPPPPSQAWAEQSPTHEVSGYPAPRLGAHSQHQHGAGS